MTDEIIDQLKARVAELEGMVQTQNDMLAGLESQRNVFANEAVKLNAKLAEALRRAEPKVIDPVPLRTNGEATQAQ